MTYTSAILRRLLLIWVFNAFSAFSILQVCTFRWSGFSNLQTYGFENLLWILVLSTSLYALRIIRFCDNLHVGLSYNEGLFRKVFITTITGVVVGASTYEIFENSYKFGGHSPNLIYTSILSSVTCLILELIMNLNLKDISFQKCTTPSSIFNEISTLIGSFLLQIMKIVIMTVFIVVFSIFSLKLASNYSYIGNSSQMFIRISPFSFSLPTLTYHIFTISFIIMLLNTILYAIFLSILLHPMDFQKLDDNNSGSTTLMQSLSGTFSNIFMKTITTELNMLNTFNNYSSSSLSAGQSTSSANGGAYNSSYTYWKDILNHQNEFSATLLQTIENGIMKHLETSTNINLNVINAYRVPSVDISAIFCGINSYCNYPPPFLPIPPIRLGGGFSEFVEYHFKFLKVTLAMQDLNRIIRGSAKLRSTLIYSVSGNFTKLMHSLCCMIDTTTVQLQLLTAHSIVDVSHIKQNVTSQNIMEKYLIKMLSFLRLSNIDYSNNSSRRAGSSFSNQGDGSTTSPITTSNISNGSNMAEVILRKRKARRDDEGNNASKEKGASFAGVIHMLVKLFPSAQHTVGLTVSIDPLSEDLVYIVIAAIDSVSTLLLQSIGETAYATNRSESNTSLKQFDIQAFVPTVLCSLLALDIALRDYTDVLSMTYSTSASTSSITLQSHLRSTGPIKSKFNSSSRSSKTSASNELALQLLGISVAVEEAINRITYGFGDIIPSFTFPSIYATELQKKLNNFE